MTTVAITHYTHGQPTAPLVQEPVIDESRVFYASTKDGNRVGFLAGPFETHEEALEAVPPAKDYAKAADPFAEFYGFGTLSLPRSLANLPKGIFNRQIEEDSQ